MIEKNLLKKLAKDYQRQESERRQIIKLSNEILFQSKKIIFALHREDLLGAQDKLNHLRKTLKTMEKKFSSDRLYQEGAYRAAAEEYLEAIALAQIINGSKIKKISDLSFNHESYLAGICDLIGELVRLATNQAAKGNFSLVPKIKKQAEEIMASLSDFDFTGYLRTKYDQSRGHLRKLEQISYDLKLREKN